MNNMKKIILAVTGIFVVLGIASILVFQVFQKKELSGSMRELRASSGTIQETISTTGVVEPCNRLKIQSSIAGRVEDVLVKEGALIKTGDKLALLSSSERAALLDAARLQDRSEQSYWENVYKKTAILAPIDGQVIVRSIEPGQTVTTSDSLFVLSDQLIVTAYVDETDIGKVAKGQKATITLDAYPDISVNGRIEHIHYESHLENNVNIYYVDVIPESIPDVFRSGMSADVSIIIDERKDVVLVPSEAVLTIEGETTVMLKSTDDDVGTHMVKVSTGLQDEDFIEITRGIDAGTMLLVPENAFVLPENNRNGSPFMPQRKKGSRR